MPAEPLRDSLPEDPLWRPALKPSSALAARYRREHLQAISPEALDRLLPPGERQRPWPEIAARLAWDLLYWNEPELYDQLVEGEPLHSRLFRELPLDGARVLEVGAGTGRLTLPCASRARVVHAVEPVTPMRLVLQAKLEARGYTNVVLHAAWADALPLTDASVDLVLSASAFGANPLRGGEAGLRELRRVTRPGGQIAVLWPDDPIWFLGHGFQYHAFAGPMELRFRDLKTAQKCAEIFWPDVVAHIRAGGRPVVPFGLLAVNAPRDLCISTVASAGALR
jgi:SAM-dependent methyltransferase